MNIIYDEYSNSALITLSTGETIQVCFESRIEPQFNGMVLTDNNETRIY